MGEQLCDARRRKGWSLADLQEACVWAGLSVSQSTLWRWETATGRLGIPIGALVSLCGVLECDPAEIVASAMSRHGLRRSMTGPYGWGGLRAELLGGFCLAAGLDLAEVLTMALSHRENEETSALDTNSRGTGLPHHA
ncbi:helix-turn-helix domain-containing protein [Actinokineospora alba]|uniref:helix-turn-helix domain-containing protein n=1 Tax=Actinokineospora alba TaxID=504798 RepID=UPI001414FB30